MQQFIFKWTGKWIKMKCIVLIDWRLKVLLISYVIIKSIYCSILIYTYPAVFCKQSGHFYKPTRLK